MSNNILEVGNRNSSRYLEALSFDYLPCQSCPHCTQLAMRSDRHVGLILFSFSLSLLEHTTWTNRGVCVCVSQFFNMRPLWCAVKCVVKVMSWQTRHDDIRENWGTDRVDLLFKIETHIQVVTFVTDRKRRRRERTSKDQNKLASECIPTVWYWLRSFVTFDMPPKTQLKQSTLSVSLSTISRVLSPLYLHNFRWSGRLIYNLGKSRSHIHLVASIFRIATLRMCPSSDMITPSQWSSLIMLVFCLSL